MNNSSQLLIVDDEEYVRNTLEMLLAPEGYQLTFAVSGQEALEKAEDLMPDLILSDVMMPNMDGFELCEHLRANPKLAEVPIILLTALDDRESRLRAIEAGADDFLSKPVDRVELRARIRTITRLNRYRRLMTERSRFEWAVEQFDDGFLILGDGDVIRYMNSTARLYLGIFKDSDIANEGFLQRIDKLYKREPAFAWENWPDANVAQSPRYLVRPDTNDEPSLWLQVNVLDAPAVQESEQLVHLRDVTEKMLLQRQMWSFHTIVSHKLRTPLNALMVLPVLTDNKMNFSKEETQDLLKTVQGAMDRLQNQLMEVLQYVDSTHLCKLNTSFNLSELPTLLANLQGELELGTVMLSIDESLPEQALRFSKEGVELVLRELLANAKKFHPQNSPQIEISIQPDDVQTVVLSVNDNGLHLPNEVLSKVWTPYYQNERFFSGEVQGMGLGLAMVARLVWGSEGNCKFYNREDQVGIRVELTLPLSQL